MRCAELLILKFMSGCSFVCLCFLYQGLAKTEKTKQKRYIALFDKMIPDYTLEEIRHSINRAWVLGDERFKQQIKKQTGRRVSPLARGGGRRSKEYRAKS